jgi:hypothetical protein
MVDSDRDARWEVPRRSGGDQTEQISNDCLAVPQVEIEINARKRHLEPKIEKWNVYAGYFEELERCVD